MTEMKNPILVTQPAMPPLDEFIELLKDIWGSKWLTNNGKYHQQLESAMAEYLGVRYVSLFANGTLALMSALQVLRINGEVITTPYTFVATPHSLHWNGIKPVFVDIDPVYGNLDQSKIEAAITPRTMAILPVHVYGNPVDVEKIQEIADTYGLKVIYDAAHAFGVNYKGESILKYGDLSILSFHATKVYSTIEGGAIICHDEKTKQRIDYLKNFGFADETTVIATGINGKMNEVQAAYGLLSLKYLQENISKRRGIAKIYNQELVKIKGIRILMQHPDVNHNYSYYPIFVDEKEFGKSRDELNDYLVKNNIIGRRYFYPLVSGFSVYEGLESAKQTNLPNANEMAEQVICLPIYPDLDIITVKNIVSIINNCQNSS
jgi:dTDP-4-amino-4,6-dideoxygalactose transaminase